MSLNTLNQVYKDSLSFPYCSASAYYFFENIATPENFWSDCYGQIKRLKWELLKNWIQAEYIDDTIVGRHRSLIFKSQEGDFYLSSYLMHGEPVLLGKSSELKIPTHPFVWNDNSILCVSKRNNLLDVTKLWPNSYRKDSFHFDINNTINNDLSYEEYLFRILHPEQTTLSIRVIDFENMEVLHYVFDFTHKKIFAVSSSGKFHKGTREFDEILKRIANVIKSSPEEIEDYIHWAYIIREKMVKELNIPGISL